MAPCLEPFDTGELDEARRAERDMTLDDWAVEREEWRKRYRRNADLLRWMLLHPPFVGTSL